MGGSADPDPMGGSADTKDGRANLMRGSANAMGGYPTALQWMPERLRYTGNMPAGWIPELGSRQMTSQVCWGATRFGCRTRKTSHRRLQARD